MNQLIQTEKEINTKFGLDIALQIQICIAF